MPAHGGRGTGTECDRSHGGALRGVAHTEYDFVTFPIGIEGKVPMTPNILYLNSHDTGRYVQPYGYPVPTPNIQHLADQGAAFLPLFRAAPVCSGSRAALLTGQSAHGSPGMLGLAHRGYRLAPPPERPTSSTPSCARRATGRA